MPQQKIQLPKRDYRARGAAPFSKFHRISQAIANKFEVISEFNRGYRNREDKTNLPPNVLVSGSHDVLTNVSGRIGSRKGYTLDGAANTTLAGIKSSYDYEMHTGTIQHLRAGFLTSAGNDGKLQFRYKNSSGTVTWKDLLTGLTSVNFNFCNFGIYSASAFVQSICLFVNGGLNVWEWSGGTGTFSSGSNATGFIATLSPSPTAAGSGYVVGDVVTIDAGSSLTATATVTAVSSGAVTSVSLTSNGSGYSTGTGIHTTGGTGSGLTVNITAIANKAIKVQGTLTVGQLGFYTSGTHTLDINGTHYTYTSVSGDSFVGINTDPSAAGSPGDLIFQVPESTNNVSMTSAPSTHWTNSLVATQGGRLWLGCTTSNDVYISKSTNYKDFSSSSPPIVGDGSIATLDGPTTALISQDDRMYISAGTDQWYEAQFAVTVVSTSTSGVESFNVNRLKTSVLQGAQTQGLTTKIGNNVVFLSNEPIVQELGFIQNILATPQLVDISYPIVNDVSSYDFTGGQIIYFKKFIYLSAPTEGKMLIYNMTDPRNPYWEAPQTLPVGRFSIIDGNLYGHDYSVPQTYKLFTGYNDNGNFINANASFAFNSGGMRPTLKNFNEFYVEGYISSNSILTLNIQYELNGTTTMYNILGTDTRIVQQITSNSSLGKRSFGKIGLGSDMALDTSLPPKFRVIKTFIDVNHFESQVSFTSNGADQQWEILAFGPAMSPSTEQNVSIRE